MGGNFLERILEKKRQEVEARRRRGLFFRPFWEAPRRDLARVLERARPAIIAEIKRASPSKGLLAPEFDPLRLARAYQRGGAAALSVITDEPFFQGSLEYLAAVRAEVDLPLLRKDFILDPVQIEEARAFGADAVLLIVSALTVEDLRELLAYARRLSLSALVEVHDEEELETALWAGAQVIGINNRNLRTFEVSVETTLRLLPRIPPGRVVVSESGLSHPETLEPLARAGVAAFLIGEALVTAPDPEARLKAFTEHLAGLKGS
ncbi:indole-3-glycerol phosphate synthase TrpC [Thermosulfurimonas marina]|uniref:Indole-3-glycerol phosphate synthase n=1 Tax=Thermosulfurimonas marina TaxID=2047767 RepID=A0A6H1WRS2_9BACT|nr:indole-3-glycerol phosphate synthase TrpC [Thermosulfurimonas marina]QJA05868.1 indole-3-glycerol phosphate synthase TrpC [Thermosulfurimonas marina]